MFKCWSQKQLRLDLLDVFLLLFYDLKLHYSYNYVVDYMSNNIIIKSDSHFHFLSQAEIKGRILKDYVSMHP